MKTPTNRSENKTESRVIRGSANVFADLGFKQSQAAELQVKAELVRQPDVSKLMNARVTGYSTDRLIALLNALEVDVDIVLRPRKANRHHHPGLVRVKEAAAA